MFITEKPSIIPDNLKNGSMIHIKFPSSPLNTNDNINTAIIPIRANASLITPFLNPTIKNIIKSNIIPTSNIFNILSSFYLHFNYKLFTSFML